MLKDTLGHGVHIQSLEVGHGEVRLELFPKVNERVETFWDQDVLEREDVKSGCEPVAHQQLPFYCCHIVVCLNRESSPGGLHAVSGSENG